MKNNNVCIFRSCEQRLKSCDDAFRHQLETKQKAHDRHVTKVVAEKDQEIAQAHQRVSTVIVVVFCRSHDVKPHPCGR